VIDTPPNLPLAGVRVLIVEDRYLIASEMAAEVSRMGGQVLGPFRDLATASELLEREPVDLALLDVNLDHVPVYPLAHDLEARGVPFLFLTGYDEEVMPAPWKSQPRLLKPVNPRALEAALVKLRPAKP
jgi:DNA-binding response OmpR family regulator